VSVGDPLPLTPGLFDPTSGSDALPSPLATVSFVVYGEAKTAGSKKAFKHPHTERIIVTDDTGKAGKQWRSDVKIAAIQAMAGRPPLASALQVRFAFYRHRPKSHFGTGGRAHVLKPSAPHHPTTRPDLLKTARAIEDAMTGIVYMDDSLIVVEELTKRYGAQDYVEIGVWELPG
jgi:Holliday junction resolvase RusA-like endonuclease